VGECASWVLLMALLTTHGQAPPPRQSTNPSPTRGRSENCVDCAAYYTPMAKAGLTRHGYFMIRIVAATEIPLGFCSRLTRRCGHDGACSAPAAYRRQRAAPTPPPPPREPVKQGATLLKAPWLVHCGHCASLRHHNQERPGRERGRVNHSHDSLCARQGSLPTQAESRPHMVWRRYVGESQSLPRF
jgi:hypothetical protein